MLAGLVFCEMLSQYPQTAFQGSPRVAGGGQQQFATQTLRVHLLGLDKIHFSDIFPVSGHRPEMGSVLGNQDRNARPGTRSTLGQGKTQIPKSRAILKKPLEHFL